MNILNFKSKALLKNYMMGLIKILKDIYDYKSDFIIIRSFNDINFISKLIKIVTYINTYLIKLQSIYSIKII